MSDTVQRIVKNTAFLTIAEVVTKGLSFVLIIIIARYLGDVGFGKYSFALAFTTLFSIFSDMGFSTLTIREVARDKSLAQKYLNNGSFIKLILSVITFVLIVILINVMKYPMDTILAVYIAGGYAIITSFNQFLRSIFRAFEKMEYEAFVRISEILMIFALVSASIYLKFGLMAILFCYLIGSMVRLLITVLIITANFVKPTFNVDLSFWKESIKEALPFGISGMFVLIYFKIDSVMLSIMKDDAVVGWYNAAYQLIFGLMIISTIIVGVIFPVMSKYHKDSKKSLKKVFTYASIILFVISIPIVIIVYYFSNDIIISVYGVSYSESINALKILIFVIPIIFLTSLFGPTLESMNKQRTVSIVAGSNAILNIILNYLLIPTYSYKGAAVATVVTEALGLIIMGFIIWNIFKRKKYDLME
ncbi:MAG: flippase [Candidatus Methanoperedens sp.]